MKLMSFMQAGSGAVASQAITFLAMPVIFRLYEPADFAPWAIALAIVTLVGGIATMRYDLAVVVERDHRNASALFWLSLGLAMLVGLLGSLALTLPSVSEWLFPDASITLMQPMITIWLILIAGIQALQGWVLHRGAFLVISLAQIGNAATVTIVQFIGGYVEGGAQWLIFSSILGQAVLFTILLLSVIKSGTSPDALGSCAGRIRMLLVSYKRFPLFSVPYTLCSIIRERAAVILLGGWTSPADVGYYSQAWRIMNFPVSLSGSAIRPVVFYAAAEQGLAVQESRIGKILTALVFIGAPWLAIIFYRPEDLFGAVLGQPWRNAGTYAAIFSIPVFLFVLSNWMDRILDVIGRQDLNLFTEFLSATTSIAGLLIALASGASILTAVAAQSIILALNYALFIVIAYRISGYRLFILVRLLILLVILVVVFLLLLHVVVGQEPGLKAFIWGVVPVSVVSMVSGWLVMRGLQ